MRSRIAFLLIVPLLAISVIGLEYGFLDFGGRGQRHGMMYPQTFWNSMVVVPIILVVVILVYIILFPELSEQKATEQINKSQLVTNHESALDGILKVLKEDEKKVVEALVEAEGTMLQKDIRWKLGLSRVKTHRILARLADRGIVTVEKHYNTNKITIADWLVK